MATLDIIIRYMGAGLAFMMAFQLLRSGWRSTPARYGMWLSFATGCLMLSTAPPDLRPPAAIFAVLRLADGWVMVLVWWFGRALFDDGFRLRALDWAVAALYVVPSLTYRALSIFGSADAAPAWLEPMMHIATFIMMGHLIYVTLKGRQEDLVESRRSVRIPFALGLAVMACSTVIVEDILGPDRNRLNAMISAFLIFPFIVWGHVWLLRFEPGKLRFRPTQAALPVKAAIDPRDRDLETRLATLMQEGRLYREQGLTIGALAEALAVPEHRLRQLINQGLGYRNFTAYLNGYRLAEAKRRLADPAEARTQILTIAMDVGFNSLAPFNRAFKAAEACPPSEFRDRALKDH